MGPGMVARKVWTVGATAYELGFVGMVGHHRGADGGRGKKGGGYGWYVDGTT